MPTSTQTPLPSATASATATQTATPPPTATPTPTLPPIVLALGEASGAAGAQVQIAATLSGSAGRVSGAQANITFDSTRVGVPLVAGSQPDCTIDPSLGPGTAADKLLFASLPASPPEQQLLIVILIGFNQTTVPDGPLFTCHFDISAGAPAGDVPLAVTPIATDPLGTSLPISATPGRITVGGS